MNINCSLFRRVAGRLIARALLAPYWHLPQYMERFWLVPFVPNTPEDVKHGCYRAQLREQPVTWLLQKLGISVRVHRILRSDDGPLFHDHPASFISIICFGSYFECTPRFEHGMYTGNNWTLRTEGDVYFRRYSDWHRIEIPHVDVDHGNGDVRDEPEPVLTIFIMFRWRQKWGYLTQPSYKQYYRDVHREAAAKLPEIK